jgi:hypothetical protein
MSGLASLFTRCARRRPGYVGNRDEGASESQDGADELSDEPRHSNAPTRCLTVAAFRPSDNAIVTLTAFPTFSLASRGIPAVSVPDCARYA